MPEVAVPVLALLSPGIMSPVGQLGSIVCGFSHVAVSVRMLLATECA